MNKTETYSVTKQMLLNAAVPQQTRTYKPVSHQQLMDLTLEGIHNAGFKLDKELYSSARNGNIANGRFTISNVMDSEMQLEVGWQNSYDKSLTLKFAIGTRIFICQNGSVSGDYGAFKKKHVGDVQVFTPSAISEYIKSAGDAFQRMQKERDAMKQVEITKRTKAELIGRMLIEESFIHSTQMNIIANELQNPTHDYGAPDSMWELYNFTTFAMKEIHPTLWMKNHIKAHEFFVNESGVLVGNVPPIALTEQIMAISGDTQEEIDQFRQLTMF
jgi:hypothetical protein